MATEIRIAKHAGTCLGVERALNMVRHAAEKSSGPVLTLGPLIHNPRVISELEASGIGVTGEPAQGPGTTLVIRAHGVAPEVERAAKDSGATVLDATCPFVKATHLAAQELAADGYQVVILGDRGHAEVEATLAYAPDAHVVGSPEEAAALDVRRRVGVVVQTTQSQARLEGVASALVGRVGELRVMNTICSATSDRQKAAVALATEADVMVVVGSRSSANTTRLAQICSEVCPLTRHVAAAWELDPSWFEGAALVGITAGASTPMSQVDEVRIAIERMTSKD